jgi:isoleucyl-tRNA synthetase
MSLHEVSNSVDFVALEERVFVRWQRERTFERSLAQRGDALRYVFYDGPPFATGLPHYGHLLTSFDVVPRYQTMRGYYVPRRWGWDCHGLPVELEVENQLGVASPAGDGDVAAFNAACRGLVMRYADEWERVMTRLGRWVDFAGAYKTMDADYTDSVVWAFAELHRRGLVYEGRKVVAYCTRCRTALSNFETRLDDAYRARVDVALTVRFPLVGQRAALLAWSTTPWTLPANAALAVHPTLDYVLLEHARGDSVWLAAAARERYAAQLDGFVERERRRGRELAGLRVAPPFDYFTTTAPVLAADWVSANDGTGVVHLAPAFGDDDQRTCAAHDVAGENPVRDDGTYDARVLDFAGLDVHAATEPVYRALADRGLVFARGDVTHDVAHCWRCDHPLVYRATQSWYVEVSKLRERLLAHNATVRWVPRELGESRFADWLANARDWAVSRNRFWGAPVPVWRCVACGATRVVGSRAELEQLSGRAVSDWYRPAVDAHVLACACGGEQRRVPDVLDCWFESGAMPFASEHVPFEHAARFAASFPGDFVVEYIAQTRGWFYTMLVLATALYHAPPFRAAVCHGVLLGEDGRKMSKRLRNYPDPMELVASHGSDALRVALLTSGVVSGADARFFGAVVRDAVRRFHLPLWNALHLVTAYAAGDGFAPSSAPDLAAGSALDRSRAGCRGRAAARRRRASHVRARRRARVRDARRLRDHAFDVVRAAREAGAVARWSRRAQARDLRRAARRARPARARGSAVRTVPRRRDVRGARRCAIGPPRRLAGAARWRARCRARRRHAQGASPRRHGLTLSRSIACCVHSAHDRLCDIQPPDRHERPGASRSSACACSTRGSPRARASRSRAACISCSPTSSTRCTRSAARSRASCSAGDESHKSSRETERRARAAQYARAVRMLALTLLVVACAKGPTPPAPWTSGSTVRAGVFTSDGFASLAARVVPNLNFTCSYDLGTHTIRSCPDEGTVVGYADDACTMPLFYAPHAGNDATVISYAGQYFQVQYGLVDVSYGMSMNGCGLVGGVWALQVVGTIDDVHLGATVDHVFEGVHYTTYETADGFSVITSIDGSTSSVTESTNTRLRNVYDESGGVRRLSTIYDSVLDHVCTPGGGFCLPYGDGVYTGICYTAGCSHSDGNIYGSARGYVFDNGGGVLTCDQHASSPCWYPGPMGTCMQGPPPPYLCQPLSSSALAPLAYSVE